MKVGFFFGTETGNAEMVALDLAEHLGCSAESTVVDLAEAGIDDLTAQDLVVIVCSTYGEGDLPATAEPFSKLLAEAPDLSGLRFAVFGLGDSTYDQFCGGSQELTRQLEALGAERVGNYGHHDAAGAEFASDAATAWIDELEVLA